jgi:mannose-1-phosphate guanylyltransferase
MRAILLAAGLGTRLRPLTIKIPKCLVPIKNQPLLNIWMERLTNANVDQFLINTHYLSENVNDFINTSSFRHKITLFHEQELLGTAGTLLSNLSFYQNEDGMLIHADNYCLADINEFIKAHNNRPKNCLLTMMTFRAENPSSCGIVVLNDKGVVIEFYEKVKNPPGNLANGAVYILSKEFLKIIHNNFHDAKDFSNEILNHFTGRIFSYETKEILIDIGTIENYKKVQA